MKYRILNNFYDREKEIEFLEELLSEELNLISDKKKYMEWIKTAKNNFDELMKHIKTFDESIQKRLRMINSHWLNLTLFHYLPGAPATNNPVESYFSKSLKTDSKKQFRTDLGIENQIKLAEMKRAGKLTKPDKSLLELFRIFTPFRA